MNVLVDSCFAKIVLASQAMSPRRKIGGASRHEAPGRPFSPTGLPTREMRIFDDVSLVVIAARGQVDCTELKLGV